MKTTPEEWMIVKIQYEGKTIYKVFASWRGGYISGDCWRLNSGITEIDCDENTYTFTGSSGSKYVCHKQCYGITSMYNRSVLNNMSDEYGVHVFEEMPDIQQISLEIKSFS